MKNYAIVNDLTGKVKMVCKFADEAGSRLMVVDNKLAEVSTIVEVPFPTNWEFRPNEMVVTCDECTDVMTGDVYNPTVDEFYILDITDNEIAIADLKFQLSQLELELSNFQEETWKALLIDETKLSQVWQDRLFRKREIRARLVELGVS